MSRWIRCPRCFQLKRVPNSIAEKYLPYPDRLCPQCAREHALNCLQDDSVPVRRKVERVRVIRLGEPKEPETKAAESETKGSFGETLRGIYAYQAQQKKRRKYAQPGKSWKEVHRRGRT